MAKETKLTQGSMNALEVIRSAEEGKTLAQLNEMSKENIASAHMVQLMRKGLVEGEKTKFVCPTCGAKSTKNVYTITQAGSLYSQDEE